MTDITVGRCYRKMGLLWPAVAHSAKPTHERRRSIQSRVINSLLGIGLGASFSDPTRTATSTSDSNALQRHSFPKLRSPLLRL